jgi:hypothetical protein
VHVGYAGDYYEPWGYDYGGWGGAIASARRPAGTGTTAAVIPAGEAVPWAEVDLWEAGTVVVAAILLRRFPVGRADGREPQARRFHQDEQRGPGTVGRLPSERSRQRFAARTR